ncbi:hypothetical protein L873DRAFT_1798981 [Choiromyces venosus 120613-1]|uniref:Uncharacterized protein n=1 Tax=Choiromyces venosus 120613-1 TaxID=1336337 RepID=A0A3N4K244_9PEZI|nr:hypothetical protein L873DRAFT_1798981 [Choiromyces venosus 120613-1]
MYKPGCLAITNSTGVYSGVVASGNHDSADTTNLNKTFPRALQPTDPNGVAQFLTLFPGHYHGRATHFVEHTGGNVTHVGQPFYGEALRAAVELAAPYNINMQEVPADENDMWAPSLADGGYDPFL